jgi:excisionase family DNA binding protein
MDIRKNNSKPHRARVNNIPAALAMDQSPLRSLQHQAKRLGVSVHTLRSWIYRREISFVKVGRAVRVSDAVIDRLIAEGTRPAREQF